MAVDDLFLHDQILVPTSTGVRTLQLLQLLNIDRSILSSTQNFGMAPLHYITQRGPFQDGETPLDYRYDTRVIQIVISEELANMTRLADRRWDIVDLLRPSRSFNISGGITPMIYRRWLPGGKVERGTDLVTTAASNTVTSERARFVHNGLQVGMDFDITSGADAGNYQVTGIENDYTITITPAPANTNTDIHWRYIRGQGFRDLNCLLDVGPRFNTGGGVSPYPSGYIEALRFIAHDPFWYGEEQSESWVTPDDIGDLIFDYPIVAFEDAGAWFGETRGEGRWLFAEDFVGQQVRLIYWGHERSLPIIEITGPADTPIIANTTTGVTLTLDYSISAGETVIIDVRDLSVENTSGTNLFQFLSGDIATFSIQPGPQALNRINTVNISYGGGTSESAAVMKWRNVYATV